MDPTKSSCDQKTIDPLKSKKPRKVRRTDASKNDPAQAFGIDKILKDMVMFFDN